MRKQSKNSLLDSPRVRFNWGYHDAVADVSRARVRHDVVAGRHFDKAYAAGYRAGWSEASTEGFVHGTSDAAWNAHKGAA